MSLQVIAAKVSVYEPTGINEFGQPTAVDHVYERGQVLPDWVDGHQAFVLVNTGLAAEVGDQPDDRVRPLDSGPAPVILPEHNPLTVPGSGVTGPLVVTDSIDETAAGQRLAKATGTEGDNADTSTGELAPLPADNDTKFAWETYAATKLPEGHQMTRQEAESMKKADLVAEVKARYDTASTDADDQASLPPKF